MPETIADILEKWLKCHLAVFSHRRDADVFTIRENQIAGEIRLDTRHIAAHEIKPHPPTRTQYLILLRDDGVQIIFCHAGIAFAPDFTSTGPLPDAPPVASRVDYFTLRQNLQSLIDEKRHAEALLIFNILISILDGARRIGLDMGHEEEELNGTLSELEKFMKGKPSS